MIGGLCGDWCNGWGGAWCESGCGGSSCGCVLSAPVVDVCWQCG